MRKRTFLFADFGLYLYPKSKKHRKKHMKKNILVLMAVLLTISCSEKKEQKEKTPIRVSTEVVSAMTGDTGQSYVGMVEEQEATAVSFTGMGVVKRVLVAEGQTVGKGQLLAEMDDTQARNVLVGAEAQMAQADDALKRYGMLHENGSLPEAQWVEIQSKVAQAKAQLAVARKNLADCRLVAPVSGIVGRKMIDAGETALPSQAVVSILDISSVKVRVSIPEAEIGGITSRTSSVIYVEAIKNSFSGGQIEKGVQADALTHTYDVRIKVANTGRKLLPGMVARVSLTTGNAAKGEGSQFTVPVRAVQKKADGSLFVWTIDKDNSARRTSIGIGTTMGNRVAVTSGLQAEQCIVTDGYQKLSEGTKVVF